MTAPAQKLSHASLQQAADVPLFGQWMAQFIEHARNTRP